MRLNLRLNGWPPLASHCGCLLLGLSLAHLSWHDAPAALHLPPKSITLALTPAMLKEASSGLLHRGAKVHGLQRIDGYVCRVTHDPWLLVEREPTPILTASLSEASELLALSKAAATNQLELRDAQRAVALPGCAARPKVSYGPG